MNPPPIFQPPDQATKGWLTPLGIIFMVAWLGLACVLGAMSLMACLMANDSGSVSNGVHMAFIVGVMAGQVLTGLAGIPAGLAFFQRTRRKKLLLAFGSMLLIGIVLQVVSFKVFFE